MQKNSKNYKQFAKTQIIDTIKIIIYYLNIMYFKFNCWFYYFSKRIYTEILTKFTWATFENHWDLWLRDCVERREKETDHSKNVYKNAYYPTNKTSVTNQISRYVIFWKTRKWTGPLIDENKLQADEKNNKNRTIWKKNENCIS